jgi:putative chitinase
MEINRTQFGIMFPYASKAKLDAKFPFYIEAMKWGKIEDEVEIAAYSAHVAKESGNFVYAKEIHNGSNYEGRRDLGNIYPGDGMRYPGRGDIQLTGRDVARSAGRALGVDFENHPELMETLKYASLCSAYFWTQYKPALPLVARKGWFHVTQILVNGGENGWDERVGYYNTNLRLFGLQPYAGKENELRLISYFQASKGLFADGLVGPKTLAALRKG